jgi:hypothetical protein
MLRVLGMLVPAGIAAVLVWFLMPVSGLAVSETPVAAAPVQEAPRDPKQELARFAASEDLVRKARAMLGRHLKVVRQDVHYSFEELEAKGPDFIQSALVECHLLLNPSMHRSYLASIADVADDAQMRQPNSAQLMTCANVMRYIGDIGRAES